MYGGFSEDWPKNGSMASRIAADVAAGYAPEACASGNSVQAEHYRQALHRPSEFIKAAIG
jgi:hypothetical protein